MEKYAVVKDGQTSFHRLDKEAAIEATSPWGWMQTVIRLNQLDMGDTLFVGDVMIIRLSGETFSA